MGILLYTPYITFGEPNPLLCPDGTPAVFDLTGNKICNAPGGGTTTTGGRATTLSGVASAGVDAAIGAASFLNGTFLVKAFFSALGHVMMLIASLVLIIAGFGLDTVLQFTIIKMADVIGDPTGMGGSITIAWATLRDIANIFFIFVLLYAAFRAMFSLSFGNVGKTIVNIVLVALLINFSLFFTKVVIDASNIVAIGFYNSISSANTTSITGTGGTLGSIGFSGISGGYLRLLGLQSFYSADILDNQTDASKILVLGIMSSVFMLVAAVVLGMAAVMFVARFIILIFLMILSPVALVAIVIPGLSGQFSRWWRSLVNQAFFAPVFFALTWVSFKLGSTLKGAILQSMGAQFDTSNQVLTNIVTNASSSFGLILNYVLIIGFAITSLIVAKSMAAKSEGFGAISSAIGSGVIGGAAWLGRTTAGRTGKWVSERPSVQNWSQAKGSGFVGRSAAMLQRTAGRAALYTGEKAKDSTFDIRRTTVPTSVVGDVIRGTVGRTKFGKAFGLDDVNTSSIEVGSRLADEKLFGKPGEKGYRELRAESEKRVSDREAKEREDYKAIQTQKIISSGKNAVLGTAEYKQMEDQLAKLSEKETETLVASNKDLLKSQNFANMISVKQLEAIMKSDKFAEADRQDLRSTRFEDINNALKVAKTSGAQVPLDIRQKIRSLSDSEIEMVDPGHLENEYFVNELKSSQIDNVLKNTKFSKSKRDEVGKIRKTPLINALHTGSPAYTGITSPTLVKDMIVKKLGAKEITSLMGEKIDFTNHTGAVSQASILTHPEVIDVYTPKILKRMAEEMDSADIQTIRTAIEDKIAHTIITPGSSLDKVNKWLSGPNGSDFS